MSGKVSCESLATAVRDLRGVHPTVPMIVMVEPCQFELALQSGATDVLSESAIALEGEHRIRARATVAHERTWHGNGVPASGSSHRPVVVLRATPGRILAYLFANAGRPVTAAEIQRVVLQTRGLSHAVHNHIYEIRKALRRAGITGIIRTYKGLGAFSVPPDIAPPIILPAGRRL